MEIIIMHIIFIAFCIYIGYTIGRKQVEIKQKHEL